MLAQITPEWGSFLKESGVIGGIAFLLLYGMYLLINRYLNQQEKDRELLIKLILDKITSGNTSCERQTQVLTDLLQAVREMRTVVDRNVERLECLTDNLDKVEQCVASLKGLWK